MGRRRGIPPPPPFAAAFAGIDTLERNVIETIADVPFTADEVTRWLVGNDAIVEKLKAAFPYTRDQDRTTYWHQVVALPVAGTCLFTVNVKAPEIAMLVPSSNLAPSFSRDDRHPIIDTVQNIYREHQKFEQVRKVVSWLNDNATAGAARHYCPWLTSVLPADHPFHNASGQGYREPAVSMSEIVPIMRQCGAIMASALLCGSREGKERSLVHVGFSGVRDNTNYTSSRFGLL